MGEVLDKQLSYWKDKLDGYESLNLITDSIRPSQIDYRGKDVDFELGEVISTSLRELAKELKVSLYSLLLAGYYLMLRSYSNQDDIVVGTPVVNRHYGQIEDLIEFFVNSLALRVQIDTSIAIKDFIKEVGREVIEAQLHQDLPFEKLVEELNIEQDTSRHPIFQVMFGVQGFGLREDTGDRVQLLESYTGDSSYNVAKFDMSAFIDDSHPMLSGSFNYAVNLYDEGTVTRFISTYKHILEQFAELTKDTERRDQIKISDLSYLTQAQYQLVVYEWNATDRDYPRDKTIQWLFEEQVERTPNNVAVVYENKKLTYRQLNERSNQLAHYLVETYDITPDTLIALCLDSSEHMLIGILAVLKAGAAYVPMDPGYPAERIEYILEDTQAKVVLCSEVHTAKLTNIMIGDVAAAIQVSILAIDSGAVQKHLKAQFTVDPRTDTRSTNLAYVIYTSGTTGKPKGVMIEHKSVVNLSFMQGREFGLVNIKTAKNCLCYANYVFDAHVWEIYIAVLNGHKLYIINNTTRQDLVLLSDYIRDNCINIATIPPVLLDQENLLKLDILVVAGDKTDKRLLDQYQNNSINIINAYGPTEGTVCVSLNHYNNNGATNIGTPISNTRAYVLDPNLHPLPIGAVGELYIGGVGLARGYLNRPDLTSERFIGNPFQSKEERLDKSSGEAGRNVRLYKTGDLVRWLPDGNLEYIGRNDFQVKIRGYRIELGEIESVLSGYEGVTQSAVLARERIGVTETDGSKYLVGYYASERKLDEEAILNYLQSKLPDYMVPSILVYLEKLPLTINGKLDRKVLPDPEFTNEDSYIAPRNELEKKVCSIWSEVLGLSEEKVGIRGDFFRLGGDSIISIQLVSRLRQRLGLSVSIKDIFSYKTIEKLYDNILSKETKLTSIKTEQGVLEGVVRLLPIQEWFFESNFTKPNHWNQSFIIRVSELDIDRLQESVNKLIRHHDSFRLKYKKSTQYYDNKANPEELKVLDVSTLGEKELESALTGWQSEFNIETGPTYIIGYLHGYRDGSARVYFALHHLIIDSVSWRILAEDLKDIYDGKELGLKGSSYRQWVSTVQEYENTHAAEKEYWNNVLSDYDSNANQLSKLIESEETTNYSSLELSQKQTKQLLQESGKAYNTEINDILLTALGYALSEITENKVNHIVLEGHGREEIDSSIDITRTVGWFTTMYPVRLEIGEDIGSNLKYIKETLREIPTKGIGYGTLVGYKNNKLPRISFNYLGQFDKDSKNWNVVSESSGVSVDSANRDNNIMNINGLVIDGKLQFGIASKLDKESTDRLKEVFKKKLKKIIEHCIQKRFMEYTMSDFHEFERYTTFHNSIKFNHNKLFMFPPGGGGAESYFNNIVVGANNKHLVLFNNYYDFLEKKFGKEYLNKTTYEILAEKYIPCIKSIQSQGEYNLFGWSFGGVLAFEVARQLLSRGDNVANIILIDSYFCYKKAIDLLYKNTPSQHEYTNDINYKYNPQIYDTMRNTTITLFKTLQAEKKKGKVNNEENFYVKNTKFNFLDKVLGNENISTITLNCNHNSCLTAPNSLNKICSIIKTL